MVLGFEFWVLGFELRKKNTASCILEGFQEATFSERSLGKSLVPYFQVFCHKKQEVH